MQPRKTGSKQVTKYNSTNYRTRLQPVRTEYQGQTFDSATEAAFYKLLKSLFPAEYRITKTFKIEVPGKARDWRIDFGIEKLGADSNPVFCPKLEKIKHVLQQKPVKPTNEIGSSILLIEFKGAIDTQEPGTEKSGRLAKLDTNFVSRINHFRLYAPYVLDDLVCVGVGSGAVVTYCINNEYCVTPVINTKFFSSVVKDVLSK